jgi:fibronectin type 3 domain-containing protein
VDVENTEKILAITSETMYRLPYENGKTKYTYVVTSLDRVGNESKITKKKIKL